MRTVASAQALRWLTGLLTEVRYTGAESLDNYRVRTQYTKVGDLRFISHLDLTRVMERAVKRAGLPIAYSEGFHPMPKISYGPALALGITSRVELADFTLNQAVSPEELRTSLNRVLSPEAQILLAREVPVGEPALTSVINRASYRVSLTRDKITLVDTLSIKAQDILERESLVVKRVKKGKSREVEIRPFILDLAVSQVDEAASALDILIVIGSDGATNPREILSLFGLELAQAGVFVERTGLYQEKEGRLLSLIG